MYTTPKAITTEEGATMDTWKRTSAEVFERMSKIERELNASILRRDGKRLFLDMLEPGTGRYEAEPAEECSLLCAEVVGG